jgi:hypothetical protein
MIRLRPAALHSQLTRALARDALDVGETGVAINLRLALTQQIQIGAVENSDFDRH